MIKYYYLIDRDYRYLFQLDLDEECVTDYEGMYMGKELQLSGTKSPYRKWIETPLSPERLGRYAEEVSKEEAALLAMEAEL